MKKWKVRDLAPEDYKKKFSHLHPIIAQLLYNRKIESQLEIDSFFNPEYENLHDPFLFQDMDKAVKRIDKAIKSKEKILVHGDYDADGVTSSAVLYRALKLLGADVEVFIPHREDDGYGLNINNVNKFVVQGIKLLITVDCGITNVAEVEELKKQGIEVIVTDHHEPPKVLPEAYCILDPKVIGCDYPFRDLAGAGVAYKVVQALLAKSKYVKNDKFAIYGGTQGFAKWLLDIVAIGTVADVSILTGENRILVKWGLIVLAQTRWLGLKSLLEQIRPREIDSFTIGFQIAPRLNAAGRLNHAVLAFDLLVTDDKQTAEKIATELQANNTERQKIIEKALNEARTQLDKEEKNNIILVYNENWLPGIIGLIAGRLSDEFYRPTLAMTNSNGSIVGSGRSIEGFNIVESLRILDKYFARYGGHAGACGFTLTENEVREKFEKEYLKNFEQQLEKLDLTPVLPIDCEIHTSQIGFEMLEQIKQLAPFGEGNERPLFLIKNLQITSRDRIGQQNTHLGILAKQETPILFKFMWFSKAKEWFEKIKAGDIVDIVCEVGINEWNGNREFEFKIQDLQVNE